MACCRFFASSVGIMVVAQACYAFLFVATFARHLRRRHQVVAFVVCLPFSQLVPVFTLIESLHLSSLNDAIRRIGLRPTEARYVDGDADSLWIVLQRKLHAHAGFLLEALVEAIPQCTLQVGAAVLTAEVTNLAVISIMLSLSVICSKGWLAAYSLHRPTFIFNSLAIAADVACLFASVSWAATSDAMWAVPGWLNASSGSSSPSASLTWAWLAMLAVGGSLGVLGGCSATLFSCLDDHLKAHLPSQHFSVGSVSFDIYLVRILTWFLSIVPCLTLLATLRFSLLPLLCFKSLSSEHAMHQRFFQPLFEWLMDRSPAEQSNAVAQESPQLRPLQHPSAGCPQASMPDIGNEVGGIVPMVGTEVSAGERAHPGATRGACRAGARAHKTQEHV